LSIEVLCCDRMANELFQTGEEFVQKRTFRPSDVSTTQIEVTLYNDTTDALVDGSLIGDLTTEPGGITRQTVDLDTAQITPSLNASNNYQVEFDDQTFNTEGISDDVDAYVTIVNFQSEVAGDGSPANNLFFAGLLDQTYDLSIIDEFVLRGIGIAIN